MGSGPITEVRSGKTEKKAKAGASKARERKVVDSAPQGCWRKGVPPNIVRASRWFGMVGEMQVVKGRGV